MIIWLRRISSSIEMTDVMLVAFSNPFTLLPSGGMMMRNA